MSHSLYSAVALGRVISPWGCGLEVVEQFYFLPFKESTETHKGNIFTEIEQILLKLLFGSPGFQGSLGLP